MTQRSDALATLQLMEGERLRQAYRAVEPAYPVEGCGFVFVHEEALHVVPAANRAEELHQRYPDDYPRGEKDWFEPDQRPLRQWELKGGRLAGIFHSHPDVGAYFSEGDIAGTSWIDDHGVRHENAPGVVHIVVSVRSGVADGAAAYYFDDTRHEFVELARFDEHGARDSAA
jgi:proteasome lid subunit RPN8/RPN11